MTKINASSSYKPKAVPVKIVSKSFPPTEDAYHETHLRHRDGREMIYVSRYKYGQHNEETKWCSYCSCVTRRVENGNATYVSSRQFESYRNFPYRNYVCPDCKPKCEKAHEIVKQISKLKAELNQIDGI